MKKNWNAKDKAHKKKLVAKRDESIDRLNAKECKPRMEDLTIQQ